MKYFKNSTIIFICISMLLNACTQQDNIRLQWKMAGMLPQTLGVAGPVSGVHNDALIVAGGSNFPEKMPWMGGAKKYYSDGYVFKKNSGDSLVLHQSFQLPFPIGYTANCSTSDGIIAAGGENESGISDKVLWITWDAVADSIAISSLPALPLAVANAAIAFYNNKIYLAGGETKNGASDKFLFLDLNDTAKGWQPLPVLPQAVSHAVMVVQSNGADICIYLVGGRKINDNGISDLYATNFQFDINKNKWSQKQPLPYALSAGTGVAAGENNIILFGGDKGGTFHATEEMIAKINAATDEAAKQALIKEKAQLQSSHPGFSKAVLAYNTVEDKWATIDSIPFTSPVTTTAVKWNDMILIPGGEIKAGVRASQILTAKLHTK
jgi:cyclically-permuted mutarotase family protein